MNVVLDTNIVLDIFLFDDAAAKPLKPALVAGNLRWLATQHMRNELERVLDYEHLVPRMAFYQVTAADVLAAFDRHANLVEVAPRVSAVCKDPDDQCFIDLAVAHQALLLSKDKAVLSMKKRLLALGVPAQRAIESVA
ncbi:putative toxin-antitoxin system toxin component, PIN family [Rhodoferax koreensis]|nr:putative toxin-antitoxin system toxin component, PIN family [Rhodoferax koreense]